MKHAIQKSMPLAVAALMLAGTFSVGLAPTADAKSDHHHGKSHHAQKYDKHDKKYDKKHDSRDWNRYQSNRRDNDDHDHDRYRRSSNNDNNNWNDRDRNRLRDWLSRSQGSNYTYRGNVSNSILRRYNLSRSEFNSLPPGIQKRVLSGKPLPPGQLNKLGAGYRLNRSQIGQINPINDRIRNALGLPSNYYNYNDGRRVGRYGNDAVIYSPNSGIISSVLAGAFN